MSTQKWARTSDPSKRKRFSSINRILCRCLGSTKDIRLPNSTCSWFVFIQLGCTSIKAKDQKLIFCDTEVDCLKWISYSRWVQNFSCRHFRSSCGLGYNTLSNISASLLLASSISVFSIWCIFTRLFGTINCVDNHFVTHICQQEGVNLSSL